MRIDSSITPKDLTRDLTRMFELASKKVVSLDRAWKPALGTPVFTVEGKYTSRGWTEWTQGFQYGCAILAFDATDNRKLLAMGKRQTVERMAPHVTHIGVHDHGFNNLSTYGNLRRLMLEGRLEPDAWELNFYDLAIKASGAVQAARWQGVPVAKPDSFAANSSQLGYIASFNGPHSLFIDTMRTLRILSMAWKLGHVLMHENDRAANLLKRMVLHALTTSQYIIFHGTSDHGYDVAGRTAHEGLFNRNDGCFRARSTQQGYSPFSTWTRGLAWAMLGYAEELEFLKTLDANVFKRDTGLTKAAVVKVFERCARETCDHFINDVTAQDGITYWDDGAPDLHKLGDWQGKPADPYNDFEPVDSTASAIGAQGLLRLGHYLGRTGKGKRYWQAGLTVARNLLQEPYLSTRANHQGLLLHSIYHWPNRWDHVPAGAKVANGESSMWGDYHLMELGILIKRLAEGGAYPTFFVK